MKSENMRFYIKVRNKLGIEPKMIQLKSFDQVHAPSLKVIYNWINSFKNTRRSLEDRPRSGRPISESIIIRGGRVGVQG